MNRPSLKETDMPVLRKWSELKQLLTQNEEWLMERILKYAKTHGFVKYTSTLVEAWRMSIAGLNSSLISGMAIYEEAPDFGPDESFERGPLTEFGVIEAQRHRDRGVSLTMFLGLMKYYRQTYTDLINVKGRPQLYSQDEKIFLERCFDRIEIAFCAEWMGDEKNRFIERLQETSRQVTNEKNTYLNLLDSMEDAVIVFENDTLLALNSKAHELLNEEQRLKANYYSKGDSKDIASQIIQRSWGLPHHGLSGKSVKELFPWLQLFINQSTSDQDTVCTSTNNNIQYFEVKRSSMKDVSGKFTGTVLTLSNITPRHRFEKTLETIVTFYQNMHQGDLMDLLPAVLEKTLTLFKSNVAACALFDEHTGTALVSLCTRDQFNTEIQFRETEILKENYEVYLEQLLKVGGAIYNRSQDAAAVQFPNIDIHFERLMCAAITDDDKVKTVICVGNKTNPYDEFELHQLKFVAENTWNIISKKQTEIALEQQKQEVEQLKRSQSLAVLAGGVAHDFNNLLAVISSHTRIINKKIDTSEPQLKKSLSAILKAIKRGSEFTKTMRACTGTSLGQVTEEELGSMIQVWLKKFFRNIPPQIKVATDIQKELPPVRLDKSQFPMIFVNLLENSLEAIGDAPGEINIQLKEAESRNDVVPAWGGSTIPPGQRVLKLQIIDTGQGMDEETLANAFDPFFSTKFTGRGLGLAAVRGLVIAHAGRIHMKSAPSQGTVVQIELPTINRDSQIPQ